MAVQRKGPRINWIFSFMLVTTAGTLYRLRGVKQSLLKQELASVLEKIGIYVRIGVQQRKIRLTNDQLRSRWENANMVHRARQYQQHIDLYVDLLKSGHYGGVGEYFEPYELQKEFKPSISGQFLILYVLQIQPFNITLLQMALNYRIGGGLQNLGNTCFFNAVIQSLLHTPWLARHMTAKLHSSRCQRQEWCVFCQLERTFHASQKGRSFAPNALISNMKLVFKKFKRGRQEDAHEFLRYFIDGMQEVQAGTLSFSAKHKVKYELALEQSLTYQAYGGMMKTRLQCLNCQAISDTTERYYQLNFECQHSTTLHQGLVSFFQKETLFGANKYKCEKCQTLSKATKQSFIEQLPYAMTVQLKRFNNMMRRIGTFIKYPLQVDMGAFLQRPRSISYRLFALIVHSGRTCFSGHYYAYVRQGESWYIMDDDRVSKCTQDQVMSQIAYLLFYEIVDETAKTSLSLKMGEVSKAVVSMEAMKNKDMELEESGAGDKGNKLPLHKINDSVNKAPKLGSPRNQQMPPQLTIKDSATINGQRTPNKTKELVFTLNGHHAQTNTKSAAKQQRPSSSPKTLIVPQKSAKAQAKPEATVTPLSKTLPSSNSQQLFPQIGSLNQLTSLSSNASIGSQRLSFTEFPIFNICVKNGTQVNLLEVKQVSVGPKQITRGHQNNHTSPQSQSPYPKPRPFSPSQSSSSSQQLSPPPLIRRTSKQDRLRSMPTEDIRLSYVTSIYELSRKLADEKGRRRTPRNSGLKALHGLRKEEILRKRIKLESL